MKKLYSFISILVFFSFTSNAQNFIWAKRIGGNNQDGGNAIEIDDYGNVYTVGFFQGVVDFDPGVGIYNLTASGSGTIDMFISKLDPLGNFIWAKKIGSASGNIEGYAIAVDASQNVYLTGSFQGTVDFDPDAGTFNGISSGTEDVYISKIGISGNLIWAKFFGGTSDDYASSIAIDNSGNIYTLGQFRQTVDFDPSGSSSYNITASGNSDVFISKVDGSGNFVWAKKMGGSNNDYGKSISLDNLGNAYITGNFYGTADFDPSGITFYLTSAGASDVFVSKLNINGNFVWAKRIGGIDSDIGISNTVDPLGNVYSTGWFVGTSDFNPGTGTNNLTSSVSGTGDIFVSKLDASGNFIWAKNMGGDDYNYGKSIAIDLSGNVYTTGSFSGTVDFDPNAGVYNITSNGATDIFIQKLDNLGNFIWAKNIGGGSGDIGYSIKIDSFGNIFTTGYFMETADFYIDAGTYNLTSVGVMDIFILKLGSCSSPLSVNINPINSSICNGECVSFTASGASTYFWNPTTGLNVTTGANVIACPIINTTYSFYGMNGNGCTGTTSATILVNPNPTIIAPAITICSGESGILSASGADYYFWFPSIGLSSTYGDNISASPIITTTYTVIGTSLNGCTNEVQSVVTVQDLSKPLASSDSFFCFGSAGTVNAIPDSNGNSIRWYSDSIGGTVLFEGLSYTSFYDTATIIYASSFNTITSCESIERSPIKVSVFPLPEIERTTTNATYGNNGTIYTTVNNGSPPYTFDWSNDGTGDFDDSSFISGLTAGNYSLTVSDLNGCKNSIDVTIANGEDLFIPTGFSPNADGINDTWEIPGSYQYDDIVVSIFNLQGQLIYYQKKKYLPWDGKYQGELVPTGDYYFVIESLSHKRKQTGTLTIKY